MTAETALIASNRQAPSIWAHPPAAIVARSEGEILPPESSWIEGEQAYNFMLYAEHAERVVLLLFAEDDLARPLIEFRLDPRMNKTWRVWLCRLGGDIGEARYYAYWIDGPCAAGPGLWHAYDPEKVLLDPLAREVFFPPGFDREAARRPGSNLGKAPLGVLPRRCPDPNPVGHRPPRPRPDTAIIYEMHVRGFTRNSNSGVRPERRGTFAGVIDKIPYLKELGITIIELLPVQQFDPQEGNYWGYMTLNFFAPHAGYASGAQTARDEFRAMVRALHAADIQVILDVVYNHTAEAGPDGPTYSYRGIDNAAFYVMSDDPRAMYRDYTGCGNTLACTNICTWSLILESLRHWVTELHVDGFRFDLASVLARGPDGTLETADTSLLAAIRTDPILRHVHLIAERWDAGWAYLLGTRFPGPGWCQWNGRFHLMKPAVETALNTVSTDDAYVNGHVTLVAPRVSGQVSWVLVDDNDRVKKGALLVQLDKEPFEDQVELKKAAVTAAEADLVAAEAQTRGLIAQIQADRFQLERAIEDVHTQVANLRANIATLKSRQATLELARNNLRRGEELLPSGGISKEELDQRRQTVKVDESAVDQALEAVMATRVGLGLPAQPPTSHDLGEVPDDLDQNYSAIRQALGQCYRSVALIGYAPPSWALNPRQALDVFLKQDREGNLDRIFAKLIPQATAIKQAETKLHQARRALALAELDLRYCDVVSEIDGVVTSRNVNPGNNVAAGQGLMAVRSLAEIWVDANFKETQLADLRIGQRVRCEVDMYGGRREFEGRITGFTMGTGQTLALLPPQNATGNFVKIVQRLPVRIELTGYDPDKVPLFVGLSVAPYVYYKERPTGPHAGAVLRPSAPLPTGPTDPTPSPASGARQE